MNLFKIFIGILVLFFSYPSFASLDNEVETIRETVLEVDSYKEGRFQSVRGRAHEVATRLYRSSETNSYKIERVIRASAGSTPHISYDVQVAGDLMAVGCPSITFRKR